MKFVEGTMVGGGVACGGAKSQDVVGGVSEEDGRLWRWRLGRVTHRECLKTPSTCTRRCGWVGRVESPKGFHALVYS